MKLTRIDIITIAVAILLPLGAYFGYFKGSIRKLRDLDRSKVELRQKATGRREAAEQITAIRNNTREIKLRLHEFFGSVPAENEANRVVDAVIQNARDAGVSIDLIRPGETVEGRTLSSLSMHLSASADFSRFYDFLLRVERDKVLITIENMELESDPLAKKCSVKLELRIYFAKSAPGSAKETQA